MGTLGESILYAGYGPNRDPDMLSQITGTKPLLVGSVVMLGVELCIQRVDQTPPAVSPILAANWGPEGKSYIVRERDGDDAGVQATLYSLQPGEMELLRDWELIELGWKRQEEVQVRFRRDNTQTRAVTELLGEGQEINSVVFGHNYTTYLNPKAKMHAIAARSREEFIKRLRGE